MPEMSGPTPPDDASFTLPARPGVLLLEHPRVDLLAADPAPRRLPEGTAAGLAVLGALVVFSCLVGGLTAGFVVIGVSTLLSAGAAVVTGHLSLGQVGAQRSTNLLLGLGAAALILGSVVSEHDRPAPEVAAGTPVPVSSRSAAKAAPAPSTDAAAPSAPSAPSRSAQVTVASSSPSVSIESAPGLTLSPNALAPRPDEAVVVPAKAPDDGAVDAAEAVDKLGPDEGTDLGAVRGAKALKPVKAPKVTATKPLKPAKAAKPAKPAKAEKPIKPIKPIKAAKSIKAIKAAKPAKAKPGRAKAAKPAKPPVVVRHGFAVVGSAVRDLL